MPRILSPEERARRAEIVERCYPTMSPQEIAEEYGFSETYAIRYARMHGLKHTPETLARFNLKRHAAIDYASVGKKLLRVYKMERFRIMSGMKQATNYHISLTPKLARKAIYRLARRGYWYDSLEDLRLYYDGETSRTRNEQLLTRRHRIEFVDARTL